MRGNGEKVGERERGEDREGERRRLKGRGKQDTERTIKIEKTMKYQKK